MLSTRPLLARSIWKGTYALRPRGASTSHPQSPRTSTLLKMLPGELCAGHVVRTSAGHSSAPCLGCAFKLATSRTKPQSQQRKLTRLQLRSKHRPVSPFPPTTHHTTQHHNPQHHPTNPTHSLPIQRPSATPPGSKPPAIRTQARSATILPNFVGLRFQVHNGKSYTEVEIGEEMVGKKLGEFSGYVCSPVCGLESRLRVWTR